MVREDFLKNYQGSEVSTPGWLNHVFEALGQGWKSFVARDKDKIKDLRHEIQSLAGETGWRLARSTRLAAGAMMLTSPWESRSGN